jgi:hypothetical protein
MYPPLAPPKDFPKVPEITSISFITLKISGLPLPVIPKNPVAWQSSI